MVVPRVVGVGTLVGATFRPPAEEKGSRRVGKEKGLEVQAQMEL